MRESLFTGLYISLTMTQRPPSFSFPNTVLAIMQKKTPNYPRLLKLFSGRGGDNRPGARLKAGLNQRGLRYVSGRCLLLLLAPLFLLGCAHQQDNRINLQKLDTSEVQVSEKTKLMLAAEQGDSQLLKQALLQGGKLNAHTASDTAFSLALKNGHEAISRILLSAGSEWQLGFSEQQSSALIVAADQGFDEIVKSLIIKGAVLEAQDLKGYTALARAAKNGHLTTLKILINAGAKVNVYPEGRSVLMHVVEKNNMLLSQIIIGAGADVNFSDAQGDTALKIARRNGYFDLDLMLVQAGARP